MSLGASIGKGDQLSSGLCSRLAWRPPMGGREALSNKKQTADDEPQRTPCRVGIGTFCLNDGTPLRPLVRATLSRERERNWSVS